MAGTGQGTERTFLHYRHVRGLITGTRGVIFFPPSSSRRFAAFFFGLGTTSRRLMLLGMRQAVHRHSTTNTKVREKTRVTKREGEIEEERELENIR